MAGGSESWSKRAVMRDYPSPRVPGTDHGQGISLTRGAARARQRPNGHAPNLFLSALPFQVPPGRRASRPARGTGMMVKEGFIMKTKLLDASLAGYEIRFQSLFHEGRALSFPCDAEGHVQMDALSDRARDNYLYARAVVGREFALPSVSPLYH